MAVLALAAPTQRGPDEAATPVGAAFRPSHHRASGSVLYRLEPVPEGLDRMLLARDYDVVRRVAGRDGGLGAVEVAVWPGQAPVFEHLFADAVVVDGTRGIEAAFADERDSIYLSPVSLRARAQDLADRFPERAAVVELGEAFGAPRTAAGASIWALRVSPGAGAGGGRPAAVVVSWLHAREASTAWLGLDLARHLLENDPCSGAARDVWFVLCANPDGAAHAFHRDRWWRKNRAYNGAASFGVDLNRNFAAGFRRAEGSEARDRVDFGGAAPGSEPEAQALTRMLEVLRPEVFVDLHAHGRLVLAPLASGPASGPASGDHDRRSAMSAELAGNAGYGLVRAPRRGLAIAEAHRAGALAVLLETGTRFQVPSDEVRAEAERLRPALDHLLGTAPALRGVARDASGAPCSAAIFVVTDAGEHRLGTSRQGDGRFGVWLDDGAWRLRFSVEGGRDVERTVHVVDGHAAPIDVAIEAGSAPARLQSPAENR